MCGLAGTLIHGSPKPEELHRIQDIFTQNLLANEERGKDATGVTALDIHGNCQILKAPIPASQFIAQSEYQHFLDHYVSPETTILLGHTRLPTKGEPENNLNNHPISVGNIVGIHNGTITNDDEIFFQLNHSKKKSVQRIGSVDSESIFSLIDDIAPSQSPETYLQSIGDAASRLIGSYASLFFNKQLPNLLFLLKYKTPISVHYASDLSTLFFSSRYVFLRKAFGRAVITEALPNQTGYIFDAHQLSNLHKTPLHTVALPEMQLPHNTSTASQSTAPNPIPQTRPI